MGRGFGRGYGRGQGFRGFGRGFGNFGPALEPPDRNIPIYREPSQDEEKVYLEGLLKDLEVELTQVKDCLKELTKKEK